MCVLIVGLSYRAYECPMVLSYTRRMMQNFLAFRDSPINPLRLSSIAGDCSVDGDRQYCHHDHSEAAAAASRYAVWDRRRCC